MSLYKKWVLCVLSVGSLTVLLLLTGPSLIKWGRLSPLGQHIAKEQTRARYRMRGISMSFFVPSFESLSQAVAQEQSLPGDQLAPYMRYYEKVIEFYPEIAEAYALLGYCYFHQGDSYTALEYFQKAHHLQPYSFWTNYNLGILYWKQQNMAKTIEHLSIAAKIPLPVTLKKIHTSSLYQGIWKEYAHPEQRITTLLQKGYAQTYALLGSILVRQGQQKTAAMLIEKAKSFYPKDFDVRHLSVKVF